MAGGYPSQQPVMADGSKKIVIFQILVTGIWQKLGVDLEKPAVGSA